MQCHASYIWSKHMYLNGSIIDSLLINICVYVLSIREVYFSIIQNVTKDFIWISFLITKIKRRPFSGYRNHVLCQELTEDFLSSSNLGSFGGCNHILVRWKIWFMYTLKSWYEFLVLNRKTLSIIQKAFENLSAFEIRSAPGIW